MRLRDGSGTCHLSAGTSGKCKICDCHPLYMEWKGQADDNEKRCESDRVSFGRSMVEYATYQEAMVEEYE